MSKLLNKVFHLGIHPDLPFKRQNKIRIFNASALVVSFICIFYVLFGSFYGYYGPVGLTLFEFITLQFGLYLVYKRYYNTAFHFVVSVSLLYICAATIIFGEDAQIHIYLLFMPLAGIMLFDKLKTIISYLVLCMLLLIFSKIVFHFCKPLYPANPIIEIIGWLNLVFTGILIFLAVMQFKIENIAFNREINFQRLELEEKNKDITDSIHYAKRIQKALMASDGILKKNLAEYFLMYKPKDIVSGDFYWAEQKDSGFMLAVCDCTGHGVPGAFMSLLNITILNETVNEKKICSPDLIFNQVREDIVKVLNPEGREEEQTDGMDAVLCCFDFNKLKLDFACANNPLWIVRKDSIIEFKPDKMPVGMHFGKKTDFTLKSVDLQKGDVVYLFTDGFADQFGGLKGKKFKYSQFKELLLSIYSRPMHEQQSIIQQKLEVWKGGLEQVDDILVMGIRI